MRSNHEGDFVDSPWTGWLALGLAAVTCLLAVAPW